MPQTMLTIPYARQQPVDNSDYIRAMSELMLHRGDVAAQARMARGAANMAAWNNVGNIAMSTFAGIGKQRDEERDRAMRQATLDREYALKQREMEERAADRRAEEAWRQAQFRENRGKEFTEGADVGSAITPEEEAQMVRGTASAGRWAHQAPVAARLPATAMADTMGIGGYSDAQGITDFAQPTRPTMSADTAAQPEQYVRTPNTQESLAQKNLERQDQALAAQTYDRRVDNTRQGAMMRAQLENMALDNKRADLALKDSAEARRDAAETRRFIAQATQDQRALQNMFTLSGQVKSHPAYTKMLDFESGLQAVESGLKQGNGLGDIAAINAFQRLVDPGVSVREGDIKLLEGAISLSSKLDPSFWISKIQRGDRLPDALRQQMQQAARDLYVARTNTYNETTGNTFRQQAAEAHIPFALIGRDFQIPDFGQSPKPGGPTSPINDPSKQPKK